MFLFGRTIVSEMSLLSTIETRTLYPSLGFNILNSGYVSSLQTSSSTSPISSGGSSSVEVHGNQLIVPCFWHSGGVEQSLAESLPLGLLALISLKVLPSCLPGVLEVQS